MDKRQIDQYIQLVYDQKSEFNKIENLKDRKIAACTRVKLNPEDTKVKDLINLSDDKLREQITDYLINNNSEEFILLISDLHLFWEIQARQMKPLTDTDVMKDLELKTKMSVASEELLERIKPRRTKIFIGEAEEEAGTTRVRLLRPETRLKSQKKPS